MTAAPRNLDELRAMTPGPERIQAAGAYIEQREQASRAARHIRDGDVRSLITAHGPAEAARRSGLSLSTVKLIRGRS